MALAVSLCNRCCFGENALISRCLRNRKIICISGTTQALFILASLVSSVACFYLAIKNPENEMAKLELTVGGVGLVLMIMSLCGCLYIADFKRVLEEGALRKTVGEAGQEIAKEAKNVHQDILQFVSAQKAVTSSVFSLEGHVRTSTQKMGELTAELELASQDQGKFSKTAQDFEKEILALEGQVHTLAESLSTVEALHREALENRQHTLERLKRVEENINQKEDFVLINIETLTKAALDAGRLSDISNEVKTFGQDDPDGYLDLIERFPSLNFM